LTIGLTHFSQLHPDSNVDLPITTLPKFASSIFPFSNVHVSSAKNPSFFSACWPTVSKIFYCYYVNKSYYRSQYSRYY
jgi:hypothetical protein